MEPLSAKFSRFFILIGAIFALTAGVVVAQRLSHDAVALLVGLGCGVTVMAPTAGFAVYLWRRQETQLQALRAAVDTPSATAAQPQIVVVAPPMLPGYSNPWSASPPAAQPWEAAPQERRFTIVGEE